MSLRHRTPLLQSPPAARRSLPAWIALPVAAGLIAVVALASRSGSSGGGAGGVVVASAITAIETIGYVGLAFGMAILALALAVLGAPSRRLRQEATFDLPREPPPVPWWARLLGMLVMLGMLGFQVAVVLAYIAELQRAAGAGGGGRQDVIPGLNPGLLPPPAPDLTSLTIALVVVTAGVVVAVAYAIRVRLGDDREAAGARDDRQATVAAVEVSLDALRREPDPRRAVIAAYAAMERSLSGAGLGRRRSEAPFEYLRRVLAAPTRAAEEIRTITLLFQRAKFSRHAVDESMRTGAIDALERIRVAGGRPS